MNQRSKKDFDEDVEKAATFLRVNCSQRGKLLVNQKSKQLFLETPNTKRIIPLGSWYYQLEGAPSLKDLPDVVLLNKRAKKDFDKDVEKATTFLLVNHSKEGNLLVNQKSEELFRPFLWNERKNEILLKLIL